MTTIPKGAKVPDDHKSPAQAEAEGAPTRDLEFAGVTLTFPSDVDDWPVESILAFEEGKVASALRSAVAPNEWAALMAKKPLKRDLAALFDQLAETLGMVRSGN